MAPAVACSVLFGRLGLDHPGVGLGEAGAASRNARRNASEIRRRSRRGGSNVPEHGVVGCDTHPSWSQRKQLEFMSVRPNAIAQGRQGPRRLQV